MYFQLMRRSLGELHKSPTTFPLAWHPQYGNGTDQFPPNLYPELRTLLQGMLDCGGCQRELEPVKEDGSWRFCVDYQK